MIDPKRFVAVSRRASNPAPRARGTPCVRRLSYGYGPYDREPCSTPAIGRAPVGAEVWGRRKREWVRPSSQRDEHDVIYR